MKKQTLKSLIIKLSKENSLLTQFTSFVAVEKRVCTVANSWLVYLYLHTHKMGLAVTVPGDTTSRAQKSREGGFAVARNASQE